MSVYLDNAAACPCDPDTIEFYKAVMIRFFANQESMGFHGSECASALKESGLRLSSALCGSDTGSLIWTNTGTGALLTAIEGAAYHVRKGEIVTTPLEHPALEHAIRRTAANNTMPVHFCKVKRDGQIDLDSLESLLNGNHSGSENDPRID